VSTESQDELHRKIGAAVMAELTGTDPQGACWYHARLIQKKGASTLGETLLFAIGDVIRGSVKR
jgi:hypothetical protein